MVEDQVTGFQPSGIGIPHDFLDGSSHEDFLFPIPKSDPIAAANNFLNALQKIPSYIEQYDSRCKALEKEIPQLEEIAGKTWKKEEELKGLKAELAALDRKIQLELAPPTEKECKEEEKNTDNVEVVANADIRNKHQHFSKVKI